MIIQRQAITILSLLFWNTCHAAAIRGRGQRELQEEVLELQVLFTGLDAPSQLLPRCAGDCDTDDDCGGDLLCFQRLGNEEVPGCEGDLDATSRIDFCARRPSENTLWMSGNNGYPEIAFPLGVCEGECDTDADCEDGLLCFQRLGNEDVPGCVGTAGLNLDICARRPTENTLWTSGNNGYPANAFPLGNCMADCDTDVECGNGLICQHRTGNEPIPGCVGTPISSYDYCRYPESVSLQVTYYGVGAPPESLRECQGNCIDDSDCEGNLLCFQGYGNAEVPGCEGTVESEVNFCARRQTWDTAWMKAKDSNPAAYFPLYACEGECGKDDECVGDLRCLYRFGDEQVPGCRSGSAPFGINFCALRRNVDAWIAGDGAYNFPSAHFPLGLCEGHCTSSADCADGLSCRVRSGDEPMSECSGNLEFGRNYCVTSSRNCYDCGWGNQN